MTLFYKADPLRGAEWAQLLAVMSPELEFRIWPDIGDRADVKYLAAWVPPDHIMTRFRIRATGSGTGRRGSKPWRVSQRRCLTKILQNRTEHRRR